MAKKGNGFGKIVAFATVAGAVAAGISYFTKYKSFHKELEEDFHDFEDDGNDDISKIDSTMNRNYVSLHADKDELRVAASDMADAAKDAVGAAKNMMKDAAGIMTDTAKEAAQAARDMIDSAMERGEEDKSLDESDSVAEEDYADGGLKEAAGNAAHVAMAADHAMDHMAVAADHAMDHMATAADSAKQTVEDAMDHIQETGSEAARDSKAILDNVNEAVADGMDAAKNGIPEPSTTTIEEDSDEQ